MGLQDTLETVADIMKAVSFSVFYLLVNLGSVSGTYIYESINWVPQNPM